MSGKPDNENLTGFLLYAKPAGVTSFSSLAPIKRALGTKKAGHTGTLDSFAEGLLVTLTGRATHLTPYITALPKTYLAVVCFGRETDTLDPTGTLIKTGRAPRKDDILKTLSAFRGKILQSPPEYSALRVKGERASDVMRRGGKVDLASRGVTIYRLELLDFEAGDETSSALFKVTCSKGTYIRSLARDIARAAGTCGYVTALRRVAVGPFRVEDAAGSALLGEFSIRPPRAGTDANDSPDNAQALRAAADADTASGSAPDAHGAADTALAEDIRRHFRLFTRDVAASCGLPPVVIRAGYESYFANGKRLASHVFPEPPGADGAFAAFYADGSFAGVVRREKGTLSYDFTVPPPARNFRVFTWDDVMRDGFPLYMRSRGTALTVGSFEALHRGHAVLINDTASHKSLFRGVVTFRAPIKSDELPILTMDQRLALFRDAGLDFAVVIDFTSAFAAMTGEEFFTILAEKTGMKYLIEGEDFRAGGGGGCDINAIEAISRKLAFTLVREKTLSEDGRKISSSWVRECIAEGDTTRAAALLGRPFALDVKGTPFEVHGGDFLPPKEQSSTPCGETLSFDFRGRQVLPKDGERTVRVVTDNGGKFALLAVLHGGWLDLNVSFPPDTIRAVEF